MKPLNQSKKSIIVVISLVILLLGIAGVLVVMDRSNNAPAAITSRTLSQAKTDLLAVENELVASVPNEVIVTHYPANTTSKVLFDCGYKDTYYWPGAVQLKIQSATNSKAILENMYNTWLKKSDWTSKLVTEKDKDGAYTLELLRNDGVRVSVANLDNNTTLQFNGFSACFALRDYDPNKAY